MLAHVAEFWKDAGIYAVTITAVLGLVALLSRARPIRFALRKLVGEPVVDWIKRDAVEPALTKHSDDVKSVVKELLDSHTDVEERLLHPVKALALTVEGMAVQLAAVASTGEECGKRLDAVQAEQHRVAVALET